MMKVLFLVHSYENEIDDPDIFLDQIHTLTEWTESLSTMGVDSVAYLRYHVDKKIIRNNITYVFVKDQYGPLLKFWQVSYSLHAAIEKETYDIIHVHNLNAVFSHRHILSLHEGKNPVVIQNHGERPHQWFRIFLQKKILTSVSGVLFNAPGQEKIWVQKKILTPNQIYIVPEASTLMGRSFKDKNRVGDELNGNPNFLWVGHLNENKDPITILKAFRKILTIKPQALLTMIFKEEDQDLNVRSIVEDDHLLESHVKLIGEKSRNELMHYYNHSDFFILGSHREYTGYSALEAIACGAIPILTDIPAFRRLTGNGSIGKLFEPGNHHDLALKLEEILSADLKQASQKSLNYFNEYLSYKALTPLIIDCYKDIVEKFTYPS